MQNQGKSKKKLKRKTYWLVNMWEALSYHKADKIWVTWQILLNFSHNLILLSYIKFKGLFGRSISDYFGHSHLKCLKWFWPFQIEEIDEMSEISVRLK